MLHEDIEKSKPAPKAALAKRLLDAVFPARLRLLTLVGLTGASCFAVTKSFGAQLSFGWRASPSPGVLGYFMYYGPTSLGYTNRVEVGNGTNATLSGLLSGTLYYFGITAHNDSEESGFANEVNAITSGVGPDAPVAGPKKLRLIKYYSPKHESILARAVRPVPKNTVGTGRPVPNVIDVRVVQRATLKNPPNGPEKRPFVLASPRGQSFRESLKQRYCRVVPEPLPLRPRVNPKGKPLLPPGSPPPLLAGMTARTE
jgi:hypothetical protein